jgi:hypothetical protein
MRRGTIGSGTTVALGLIGLAITLLVFNRIVGWAPTWRAFGVTPLSPPFFDMHVINDYAACAIKGVDAYAPHACNPDNYNIPPTWLWLGKLGLDGTDSLWLSIVIAAAAAVVIVVLFKGRSWFHGLIALTALVSPPVMMGIERGNLDLLILAIVGAAALLYNEKTAWRMGGAVALLGVGVTLKLFPMFCVALAMRFNRKALLFAGALTVLSLSYLFFAFQYVLLIRRNVPTTFVLSYGYKAIFLGIDHIRAEAGLRPLALANTWLPALVTALVLIGAAAAAAYNFLKHRDFCRIDVSSAGTAFLFGSGIFCGTDLLGTNFVYRLMFLLLCLPQLQDWLVRLPDATPFGNGVNLVLFGSVFGVLWLNGGTDGHSIFLLLPQLLDWFLFFSLTAVLMLNGLRTWLGSEMRTVDNPL